MNRKYSKMRRAFATRKPTPRTARISAARVTGGYYEKTFRNGSDARLVLAGLRAHADSVAFVHERRHGHHQTRLERGGLHLRAGRGAFDTWDGLLDDQVHGGSQLDPCRCAGVRTKPDVT